MKKKILALALSAISLSSLALSACGGMGNPPDYSDSNLQFEFYGYSAASTGEWTIDNVKYSAGEDFRTVERIKEYKEAGMSIYFPQHTAAYNGQDFETSTTKRALDMALEAGIDKVILTDPRIQQLSKTNGGLIGEGKQFASEEELDALVAQYMEPYTSHEAFYGIMLGDEPFWRMAESYGQMFKAIKRVHPECFIQYNLNPITAGQDATKIDERFPPLEEGEGEGLSWKEIVALRYEKYLRAFMDATGAKYIQYDQYPMKKKNVIDEYYIYGLQQVAELAKEYEAEFYLVTQTYAQSDGNPNPRKLGMEDLYWLNNMSLGFGIKQISYFTYWTKSDNNTEHFLDGYSFITWYGERTKLYDYMKQIMAEEQKIAPTILNFDYQTSKVFVKAPTVFNASHTDFIMDTQDFAVLESVEINKEVALVTELHDDVKDYYMYMVQNIVDPVNKGSKAFQTTVLTFGEEYEYAALYEKGEQRLVKLDKGTLTLKHKPGEATYVIPY